MALWFLQTWMPTDLPPELIFLPEQDTGAVVRIINATRTAGREMQLFKLDETSTPAVLVEVPVEILISWEVGPPEMK